MIVASVLRSGGHYDVDYVERFARSIQEQGLRFVCLSDVPVPCPRICLVRNWPGWLSKIELFRLSEPVLYLDLDTVVTGDLRPLFRTAPGFTMLEDFTQPGKPASGVMSWMGDFSRIYNEFHDSLVPLYRHWRPNRGDAGWIERHVTAELFPSDGSIVSYKLGLQGSAVPEGCRAVCFHGKPRPRDVGWLDKVTKWKTTAN